MHRIFMHLNNQQLIKFLQEGGALVDVRREEEWRQVGVVAGSHLLTFFRQDGGSDPMNWLAQLNQRVPVEQPLALICRSGRRTGQVCDFLVNTTDRRELYHLREGILGWLAEGLPVVEIAETREWKTRF